MVVSTSCASPAGPDSGSGSGSPQGEGWGEGLGGGRPRRGGGPRESRFGGGHPLGPGSGRRGRRLRRQPLHARGRCRRRGRRPVVPGVVGKRHELALDVVGQRHDLGRRGGRRRRRGLIGGRAPRLERGGAGAGGGACSWTARRLDRRRLHGRRFDRRFGRRRLLRGSQRGPDSTGMGARSPESSRRTERKASALSREDHDDPGLRERVLDYHAAACRDPREPEGGGQRRDLRVQCAAGFAHLIRHSLRARPELLRAHRLESSSSVSTVLPSRPIHAAPEHRPRIGRSMIDREQVLHVARLARLELTDEEVERMSGELSKVLGYIEKIDELDLDGVRRPRTSSTSRTSLRADEPRPSLPREVALASAPDAADGGFRVPSPGAHERASLEPHRRAGGGARPRRRARRAPSCSRPTASARPPTSSTPSPGSPTQAPPARRRDGAAGRRPARGQGPLLHRGRAQPGRLEDPRGLPAAVHGDGRRAARRRRRAAARQDQPGRVRDGLLERELRLRPGREPVGPHARAGRLARRLRRRGRGRHSRRGRSAPTPAARSASPRRCAASSA